MLRRTPIGVLRQTQEIVTLAWIPNIVFTRHTGSQKYETIFIPHYIE